MSDRRKTGEGGRTPSPEEIERLADEVDSLTIGGMPLTTREREMLRSSATTLRSHAAALRERDEARAEAAHWHSLVPRADRVQFPFDASRLAAAKEKPDG